MTGDAPFAEGQEVGLCLRRAAQAIAEWERRLQEAEADLVAGPDPDEATAGRLDELLGLLLELRLSIQRLDGGAIDRADLAALNGSWDRLGMAFNDGRSLDDAAVPAAVRDLLEAVDRMPVAAPADFDLFSGGSLSTAALRREIGKIASDLDWDAVEHEIGVVVPHSVRQRPVEIETHSDGFDGRAALAITCAPWAFGAVRAGVQRVLDRRLVPGLRSRLGQDAIGDRRPEAGPAEAQVVRVLFGTNRTVADGAFADDCAEGPGGLSFGKALVSVPNRRRRGGVPRPWRAFGARPVADASRHVLLTEDPVVLSREEFLGQLGADAGAGSAFLFVHGYATKFEAGLWRTAQLATDLDVEGPCFHYAWPSAGGMLGYDRDSESIRASRRHFKSFVETLLQDGQVRALNVVAHSKGNELVLDAFQDLAAASEGRRGARHLVMASPDVDRTVAQDRLADATTFFESVTLYSNAYDRPLRVSAGKARGPRIGGLMEDGHPFIARDVDTIDAANTDFAWFGLNHSAYVDSPTLMYDLAALLKRGTRPPDERSPVIRPRSCARGRYYQIVV